MGLLKEKMEADTKIRGLRAATQAEYLTENGSELARYAYDRRGLLTRRHAGSDARYYHYGDEGLIAEYDGAGTLIRGYLWEPNPQWQAALVAQQVGPVGVTGGGVKVGADGVSGSNNVSAPGTNKGKGGITIGPHGDVDGSLEVGLASYEVIGVEGKIKAETTTKDCCKQEPGKDPVLIKSGLECTKVKLDVEGGIGLGSSYCAAKAIAKLMTIGGSAECSRRNKCGTTISETECCFEAKFKVLSGSLSVGFFTFEGTVLELKEKVCYDLDGDIKIDPMTAGPKGGMKVGYPKGGKGDTPGKVGPTPSGSTGGSAGGPPRDTEREQVGGATRVGQRG